MNYIHITPRSCSWIAAMLDHAVLSIFKVMFPCQQTTCELGTIKGDTKHVGNIAQVDFLDQILTYRIICIESYSKSSEAWEQLFFYLSNKGIMAQFPLKTKTLKLFRYIYPARTHPITSNEERWSLQMIMNQEWILRHWLNPQIKQAWCFNNNENKFKLKKQGWMKGGICLWHVMAWCAEWKY